MQVYDKAHEIANILRQSTEYKNLLSAKQAIDKDPATKQLVQDFITKQMEFEFERMSGKPEDKTKMAQLQKLGEMLSLKSDARSYLEAYMRVQRTMADMYKIIGEAVAEGMDIVEKR